jgi:two-component system, cell cycle response regulator
MAKQVKVLVVDDDPTFTRVMVDWFSSHTDFLVTSKNNGEEALEFLKKEDVDVVLSDVVMKPMSGLELLKSLKGNPKTHHIPVLILSQYGEERGYKVIAEELGAEDYIIKANISLMELTNKIKKILSNG